ncbi:MAG TPA: YdhR family protein [Polyangiales bacterium]
MSACSVQINFDLACSKEEFVAIAESASPAIRKFAGLLFKLWLLADDGASAGGFYLFRDRASADRYVNSPLVRELAGSPAIRQLDVRVTPVHLGLSAQTAAARLAEPR